MWHFLGNFMETRIEKILQSAETEKDKEANTSKNVENINVSETFLAILKSSYKVKFLYEENENFKTVKKMLSAVEVKMKELFQNVTTSTETGFDDIIVLAIAYFNLGRVYFKDIKLDVAMNHFMRCIELLNGKELDCKAILTAVEAHLNLTYIWKKLEKLEKCYPLLDKAFELYLNYTKEEDEYPYPIDIATFFHIHNISANSKIHLTELHTITLELLVEQYLLHPKDKHKFAIYVHNLLNKELIEALNLEKEVSTFWPVASAELSIYFTRNNRFFEAKNHLAAADYILEIYSTSGIETVDGVDLISVINNYSELCANVALTWGMYGVFLLRSSIEKLLCEDNKSCEMNNIKSKVLAKSEEETKPLIFVSLKEALEHIELPHTHVSNLKDAKIILAHILKGLNIAKRYHTVDKNVTTHVEIILYTSSAYKYYAYFVEDKMKIKIIKQRIKMLENAVSVVILRCDLQQYNYCKILYFEKAIAYCTLLNMTTDKLNEIEEITDEMRMETKQLVKNIFDNFTLYLQNT